MSKVQGTGVPPAKLSRPLDFLVVSDHSDNMGFFPDLFAGDGIYYEPRWFKPWPPGVRDEFVTPNGETLPIGDFHFDIGGIHQE